MKTRLLALIFSGMLAALAAGCAKPAPAPAQSAPVKVKVSEDGVKSQEIEAPPVGKGGTRVG